MSGETIKPQNQITFGGVRVNQNDIKSKKVVKENGATRFVIDFKNGVKVKYPEQSAKKNSIIGEDDHDYNILRSFKRIDNAEITISPESANIFTLIGCRGCTVDTSVNKFFDTVCIEDDENIKSSGNRVIQDGQDSTFKVSTDESLDGAGTFIEGQE